MPYCLIFSDQVWELLSSASNLRRRRTRWRKRRRRRSCWCRQARPLQGAPKWLFMENIFWLCLLVREEWTNPIDFFVSTLGVAVGLGNIWRWVSLIVAVVGGGDQAWVVDIIDRLPNQNNQHLSQVSKAVLWEWWGLFPYSLSGNTTSHLFSMLISYI